MKRSIIVLLVLGLLVLSACSGISGKDKDSASLSEIDSEIKALQEELRKSEELAEEIEVEDAENIEDAADEVAESGDTGPGEKAAEKRKLPKLEVMETETVRLDVQAEDADKDAITYTFSTPLNSRGEWKTTYGDAGEYVVTVTASDKKLKTKKDILIIVKKKNEAPEIRDVSDITVTEGDTVRVKPNVIDVNKDEVEVEISKPVGDDGIWETDHNDAGRHKVTVLASDGVLTSEETVTITVIDRNVPPEIKGLEDLTVKEGETVRIQPEVVDLDKDKIILTISDPVGDDGVWETGYTDHGEYKITVKASDGKDTTTQIIDLKVEDVNLAPEIVSITLG